MTTPELAETTDVTAMTLGVHLLGEADLGVSPGPDGVVALQNFTDADRAARLTLLQQVREDAPTNRPAITVLLHIPRYTIGKLLVVATNQPDGAGGGRDTIEVGRFLACLDKREQRALWGRELDVELVEIAGPTLEAARKGLRDALLPFMTGPGRPSRLLIGPTGGTAAGMGLLLGAYEAGVRPRICVFEGSGPNRPGIESHDVLVVQDETVWLARLGAFDALAAAAADPNPPTPTTGSQNSWLLLAALMRLDLDGATQHANAAPEDLRQAVGLPRRGLPSPGPPQDTATWEWLRHVIGAALRFRAGRGEVEALRLLPAWAEATAAHLLLDRQVPWQSSQPDTALGHIADPYLDGRDADLVQSLQSNGQAVRLCRVLGALGVTWRDAQDAAQGRALWQAPLNRQMGTAIRTAMTAAAGQGPIEALLRRLRVPLWPQIPSRDIMLVLPVGFRNVTDAGTSPMLDAALTAMNAEGVPTARVHLALAGTPQTAEAAATIADLAAKNNVETVSVIDDLDVGAYETSHRRIYDVLAPGIAESGEVVVLTGPGGRAMSAAVVGACVQAAFYALRPVRVGSLIAGRNGTTRVQLGRGTGARIAARLAHDDTVALVLPTFAAQLELAAMQRVLATASPLWEAVSAQLDDLALLVSGADYDLTQRLSDQGHVAGLTSGLDGRGLLRARCATAANLADLDPWRALAIACIAARAAESAAGAAHAPQPSQAVETMRSCHHKGPWGGGGWAATPEPQQLRAMITAACNELAPHADPQAPEDGAIIGRWSQLQARLERVRDQARARQDMLRSAHHP